MVKSVISALMKTMVIWCLVILVSPGGAQATSDVAIQNGLVTVKLVDADIASVIEKISAQASPPFTVSAYRTGKVTAAFENVPIVQALHELIRENYTVVLDAKTRRPVQVFLLAEGKGFRIALLDGQGMIGFQDVLRTDPHRIVHVQTLLPAAIPLAKIRDILHGSDLDLRSLQHSAGNQNGGYILQAGETLDKALAAYERDHQFFLIKARENILQLAESGPDADFRVAAQEELAKIDEVTGQSETHGLLITNLELVGTAADIGYPLKVGQLGVGQVR